MNSLLYYLLQVIAASGLLYGYYHLFLRNKKFHFYNRYYLLASAIIPVIIPFLNIPVYFTTQETASSPILHTLTVINYNSSDSLMPGVSAGTSDSGYTITGLFYGLYLLPGLLLFARILFSIIKIIRLYRGNEVEKLDNISFINTTEPGTPFSFFRWLFWNKEIEVNSDKGQQVFRHELFHIRQKHSLDIMFLELITVIFWINPFIHLIKKEMRAIHEFLADEAAVRNQEQWSYAELLLMQVLQTKQFLVNPFFHNQIKRRIAMITSSQQPRYQYFRKIMVLPLLAVLTMLFAFTYKEIKEQRHQLSRDGNTGSVVDTIPAKKIESVPGIKEFIAEGVRSKIADGKSNPVSYIEFHSNDGRILFKADSIIFKSGPKNPEKMVIKGLVVLNGEVQPETFSFLNTQLIAKQVTVYPENDKEAIRKYGPKAAKGALEFTEASFIKEVTLPDMKFTGFPLGDPLIVIDGSIQVSRPNLTIKQLLDDLDPNTIESINVLKNNSATAKYGDKAVNGVIEIITGKNKNLVIEDKPVTDIAVPKEEVFEKIEINPTFPNGTPGWQKFLERNLNALVPVDNGAPAGQYTVRVRFIVDKEGKVSDLQAITKHGYGMEEEVIRVIKKGPAWIPAIQGGRYVKAYKEQPVTFMVTEDLSKEITRLDVVEEKKPDQLNEVVVVGYKKPAAGVAEYFTIPDKKIAVEPGSLYPNPATNQVTLQLSTSVSGKAVVKVTDMTGKTVLSLTPALTKGLNAVVVNTSALTKGTYIISIVSTDKSVRSYKMIKE